MELPTACPRTTTSCPLCGEPPGTPCPLDAPKPFAGPAIGAVQETCDPGDGVYEACR
jgi:hypothetical protein